MIHVHEILTITSQGHSMVVPVAVESPPLPRNPSPQLIDKL